jgi:hypothetical protein
MKLIETRLSEMEAMTPKTICYYGHNGKVYRVDIAVFLINFVYFDMRDCLSDDCGIIGTDAKEMCESIPTSEYLRIADQIDALPMGYRGTRAKEVASWLREHGVATI